MQQIIYNYLELIGISVIVYSYMPLIECDIDNWCIINVFLCRLTKFLCDLVKKNEAICCLIGFGIGISCCLMYRWFKNAFYSIEFSTNSTSSAYRSYNENENDTNKTLVGLDDETSKRLGVESYNQFVRRSKKNNKKLKKSKSNLQYIQTYDSYSSASGSQCCSHRNNENDFEEPLNDVYQNLAKFLSKQFCKNFKLRRPIKRQRSFTSNIDLFKKTASPSSDRSLVSDFNQQQLADDFYKRTNVLNSISKSKNFSLFNDNDLDKLSIKSNSVYSDDTSFDYTNMRDDLGVGVSGCNDNNNNGINKTNFSRLSNKHELNELSLSCFEEDSLDMFPMKSHRNSECDFDEFTGKFCFSLIIIIFFFFFF